MTAFQQPAGQPLWGAPKRKQPIVPLVFLAIATILISAPAAFSGSGGGGSNPISLMHNIAEETFQLTGLLDDANATLTRIDNNTKPLEHLNETSEHLTTATNGIAAKTAQLDESLGTVSGSLQNSKAGLQTVNGKLGGVAGSLGSLKGAVKSSADSTASIVNQFGAISSSIGGMDRSLASVITLMGASTPATQQFATNKTVKSVTGGDGTKFGVNNIVAGSRVMSVVLPMITTMQKGGQLPARKDSATASNPLVGTLLKRQVPDGTNVFAIVRPYDGFYGMPGPDFFVNHRVGGI
jgi:uncharacterized protein YoxC